MSKGEDLEEKVSEGEEPEGKKLDQSIVFIELFSSQACMFCPEADRLLGELARQEGLIALACHVDYFDVREGSLARPACTQRQKDYAGLLKSGPYYTPQMIVNGRRDVIGYKAEKVMEAVRAAAADHVGRIEIVRVADGARFFLPQTQPQPQQGEGPSLRLWMAIIDKPHDLTISGGANQGRKMVYHNIVSDIVDLGGWDGNALERTISPALTDAHAGFVVVAQDLRTGRIHMAGYAPANP